jgi:hypothetical protein
VRTRTRWLVVLVVVGLSTSCGGAPARVSLAGDAHSAAEAKLRAGVLADRVYLTGAVRAEAPPTEFVTLSDGDLVTVQRWFTVFGSADQIIGAMNERPPAGLESEAPPFQTSATSAPLSAGRAELKPSGRRASSMQTVDVAATDIGQGRVSVEVQASVAWIAARTPLETIPAVVDSAQLAIGYGDDPGQALQHKTAMGGDRLSALASSLNALKATSRHEYALCLDPDTAVAELTAVYAGHHMVFGIEIGACAEVDVTVDGVEQPVLADDQPVARDIASIYGVSLPGS